MLGNLIGGFIVIIIGVSLIPSVANEVDYAQECDSNGDCTGGNLSGTASTILGLTTLFYALGIMSAGVALAAQGLRAAGMLGV